VKNAENSHFPRNAEIPQFPPNVQNPRDPAPRDPKRHPAHISHFLPGRTGKNDPHPPAREVKNCHAARDAPVQNVHVQPPTAHFARQKSQFTVTDVNVIKLINLRDSEKEELTLSAPTAQNLQFTKVARKGVRGVRLKGPQVP
jgi:hypothetical protein